jgi:hypothetical protein
MAAQRRGDPLPDDHSRLLRSITFVGDALGPVPNATRGSAGTSAGATAAPSVQRGARPRQSELVTADAAYAKERAVRRPE